MDYNALALLLLLHTARCEARPQQSPTGEERSSLVGQGGRPVGGKHRPIGPGTDQGLYNQNMHEGDIFLQPKRPSLRNAVTDNNLLWPNAAVVFKVDDDVGCPESPQCKILMDAMEEYHDKSCIRFKEWTGEGNSVRVFFNNDSGACWSPVGRSGAAEQRLSLGQRCWYKGIVIHELGHAVGFWHEMNRPDRDEAIYIYWDNIISGFSSAFAKYTSAEVATLGEKFDYRSVMMYDEYAFSKDGVSPTLQSTSGTEIGPIWRKKGLSQSDIRRLHKLYHCDGNKAKSGFPYDVVCPFDVNTCGFKNGGSAIWAWRTVNDTDGYVYSTYEVAGTAVGHFVSVNFHPLAETDASMGCLRFWYLLQANGTASLTVFQVFLDKPSQLETPQNSTFELWFNETSLEGWRHVQVPLYVTRPFRLIFDSEFGEEDNDEATIALDDFELLYRECDETEETPASAVEKNDIPEEE